MEARATAKYIDVPPRKTRLVADSVRGRSVREALGMLKFMPQKSARHIRKVIESATANAENNYAMDPDTLVVSRIFVDEGPSQKRFRPRAHGRASPLIKRTSHVTAVVADKEAI